MCSELSCEFGITAYRGWRPSSKGYFWVSEDGRDWRKDDRCPEDKHALYPADGLVYGPPV